MSTPTLWRDLGQVNSGDHGTTGSAQFDPVVVGLSNGNFIAAYTDNSNSGDDRPGYDIMGRLYDPFGNPLGDSFRLNNYRAKDNEQGADIAPLSDGWFVMVYEDVDVNGTSIVYETYQPDGSGYRVDVILNDPGADQIGNPSVTTFPDDSFVVSYARKIGSNENLYYKFVSPTGTVGPEVDLEISSVDARTADIAALSNGTIAAAYAQTSSLGSDIHLKIMTPGGLEIVDTDVGTVSTTSVDPQVVALSDDRFVLVWRDKNIFGDDRQIYARIFDNTGRDLYGVKTIAGDADDDHEPSVTALADGGFVVLYQSDSSQTYSSGLFGRRYDSTGTQISNEFVLDEFSSGSDAQYPSVTTLADGRIVGAWQVTDLDDDIFAQVWDPRSHSFAGSSGHDVIAGRHQGTTILGLSGEDRIFGLDDNDWLYGGHGGDSLYGGMGADRLYGQLRDDTLFGGSGRDLQFGGYGYDDARGGSGEDSIFGGTHADVLRGNLGNDDIFGGTGEDFLVGNDGNDSGFGGRGNDRVTGGSGLDFLFGDQGRDFLNGGSGADFLFGGSANDTLVVDTVTDVVVEAEGEGSADLVRSEAADYTLAPTADIERATVMKDAGDGALTGNALDNTLTGNTGDNALFGAAGDDSLRGQDGSDQLFGGSGDDLVKGGNNADILSGGSGSNTLMGQKGDDSLDLSEGDTALGGPGSDLFVFDGDETAPGGPTIADFHGVIFDAGAEQDRLVFAEGLETGSFAYRGDAAFAGKGNSEARYAGNGKINVDHDGDGTSDIAFEVEGMSEAGQLTAQDFLWL